MKTKRYFLSNVLTDNMLTNLRDRGIVIPQSVDMEELKGLSLYSSIKNKGLLGTLRDRYGITPVDQIKTISLEKGDTIYVLTPSEKIYEYEGSDKLPDHITVSANKYIIN